MPPAQCGLRAHAATDASITTMAASTATVITRRFTPSSSSGQAVAVHRQAVRRPQVLGGLAGRLHARHEDLEVLHDLRNAGVDRQLQHDLFRYLVHVQEAL